MKYVGRGGMRRWLTNRALRSSAYGFFQYSTPSTQGQRVMRLMDSTLIRSFIVPEVRLKNRENIETVVVVRSLFHDETLSYVAEHIDYSM